MTEKTDPKASKTWPDHYGAGGQDLYAMLIEKYGLEQWKRHAVMECIQYLWRCESKGTYAEDIQKVVVICERILKEDRREHLRTEAAM